MSPGYITGNFKFLDFRCRCRRCFDNEDSPITNLKTVRALQRARERFGKPIIVTRGVSCAEHNAEIGGAKDSRHLPEHADAFDVLVTDSREAWLLVAAFMAESLTVRVYDDHIHCDDRPTGPIFIASPE
jgi:hypothetical protein